MIEFVIAIAQGVISSIIVDFIRGKREAAKKQELEAAAVALARERGQLSRDQLDEVVKLAMREIGEIIKRDPDLTVGPLGAVRLARQVARKNSPENQEELLTERLARLNDIVTQRRAALGLPIGSGAAPSPAAPRPAAVEYEQVSGDGLNSDLWNSELDAMKRRVRERRSGKQDSDGR